MGYLHDAIAALPERLRMVVVGYYFAERQMSDIAIELGVTQSRVFTNVHRSNHPDSRRHELPCRFGRCTRIRNRASRESTRNVVFSPCAMGAYRRGSSTG